MTTQPEEAADRFTVTVAVKMTSEQRVAYMRRFDWSADPGYHADIAARLPEDVAEALRQGCSWLTECATFIVSPARAELAELHAETGEQR
jgi:hypothetical protein